MKRLRIAAGAALIGVAAMTGCKKTADNRANFTKAINTYYESRPACLWPDPIKFPVQVDTSDQSKTQGYDALVDQGLLTRTTGEKKVFIVGSREVTNYDLSSKGRSAWGANPNQPGYGNFCYGRMKVSTIDSFTPTTGQPGATTTVNYHVILADAPSWAQAAETQVAFPQIKTQLAGPVGGTATLTDTSNGWAVTQGPQFGISEAGASTHTPATAADGQVVQ